MERLLKTGQLKPRTSREVSQSRIGIGLEKLDRAVFDPEKCYDKLEMIGVKWIRILSGWMRTETEPGIYNFEWLDSIVDNLIERGMIPWICLCYGNGVYTEAAKEVFGSVGWAPINTERERTAWSAYVEAITKHYIGRVSHFEVWNEPDSKWCWKSGANPKEYAKFVIDTAKAVKASNPMAKVFAGSVCLRKLDYINTALAEGIGDYIDAVTFHEYTHEERFVYERANTLASLCRSYNPKIKIIQGESGSQSRSVGSGALKGGAWTPDKQAKQLLRHTVADLSLDVEFTSYFSSVDMIEALNGTIGDKASYMDYGYFGVLQADFDEDGFSTGEYTPKKSYYALQNLCSLFSGKYSVQTLPIMVIDAFSTRIFDWEPKIFDITAHGFRKDNGAMAYLYWRPSNLITTSYEGTITLQAVSGSDDIHLIDLMDGSIYLLPEDMIEKHENGCCTLHNLPLMDYPLVLTFGDFEVEI